MSSLTFAERKHLEALFGMSSGYVLNFSDETFGDFVFQAVGADIHSDRYRINGSSKAKKLRAYWTLEDDPTVGRLLAALIEYRTAGSGAFEESKELESRCRTIADRLIGGDPVSIPSDYGPTRIAKSDERSIEVARQRVDHDTTARPAEPVDSEAASSDEGSANPANDPLVKLAMRQVPGFRLLAAGAAALVLAAYVLRAGANPAALFLVVGMILVAGMAIWLIGEISKTGKASRSAMASFFAWALTIIIVLGLFSVLTSAVIGQPWKFREWIEKQLETKSEAAEPAVAPTVTRIQVPSPVDSKTPAPTASTPSTAEIATASPTATTTPSLSHSPSPRATKRAPTRSPSPTPSSQPLTPSPTAESMSDASEPIPVSRLNESGNAYRADIDGTTWTWAWKDSATKQLQLRIHGPKKNGIVPCLFGRKRLFDCDPNVVSLPRVASESDSSTNSSKRSRFFDVSFQKEVATDKRLRGFHFERDSDGYRLIPDCISRNEMEIAKPTAAGLIRRIQIAVPECIRNEAAKAHEVVGQYVFDDLNLDVDLCSSSPSEVLIRIKRTDQMEDKPHGRNLLDPDEYFIKLQTSSTPAFFAFPADLLEEWPIGLVPKSVTIQLEGIDYMILDVVCAKRQVKDKKR